MPLSGTSYKCKASAKSLKIYFVSDCEIVLSNYTKPQQQHDITCTLSLSPCFGDGAIVCTLPRCAYVVSHYVNVIEDSLAAFVRWDILNSAFGRRPQMANLIVNLWYCDSNDVDNFISSFPSVEEARQHVTEGLGHLRRAPWRYSIECLDPHSRKQVCCESVTL